MQHDVDRTISSKLVQLAEARLADWEILAPLDVAYDVWFDVYDGGPVHAATSDRRFRGYGLWAERIGKQSDLAAMAAEPPDGLNEAQPQRVGGPDDGDDARRSPTLAAVDHVALMENARLSIGLMMVFERDSSTNGKRFYCLHYYDAMQRLVSATDRLRTLYVTGLCGSRPGDKKFAHFLRKGDFRNTFRIESYASPRVGEFELGRQPHDNSEFVNLHKRIWKYVENEDALIARVRIRRNKITHVLGTIPGDRVSKQISGPDPVEIPTLLTIYESLGSPELIFEDYGKYIKESVDFYREVLQFGSLIFELVESLGQQDGGPRRLPSGSLPL